MVRLFANSGDPNQTPHSAASDLGLHCLPIILLGSPDYSALYAIILLGSPDYNGLILRASQKLDPEYQPVHLCSLIHLHWVLCGKLGIHVFFR